MGPNLNNQHFVKLKPKLKLVHQTKSGSGTA